MTAEFNGETKKPALAERRYSSGRINNRGIR